MLLSKQPNIEFMKKTAVLLMALLSVCVSYAQFSIGPKAGFTSSKLSTDKSEIQESFKSNFLAGAFVRFGTKKYIQIEANFTPKGGAFSSSNVDFAAKSIKLNTIEMPVLFGMRLLSLSVANLRIMAGPVASYVVDKEVTLQPGAVNFDKDIIKDLVWGVQGGVGIDVLMFTLDVRYERGLNDLFESNDIEMKPSLFNVSLGLKIF